MDTTATSSVERETMLFQPAMIRLNALARPRSENTIRGFAAVPLCHQRPVQNLFYIAIIHGWKKIYQLLTIHPTIDIVMETY
jgi:hypothetical protein